MTSYKDFYVYALLDPRSGGEFSYGNYAFTHKPFYIGRGRKNRCFFHTLPSRLDENYTGLTGHNPRKIRTIKKIIELGLEIIIVKLHENLNFDESKSLEKEAISRIKRIEENGPLLNLTEGGDGIEGFKLSEIAKAKIGEGNRRRGKLSQASLDKMSKTKEDFFDDPIKSIERRNKMKENAIQGVLKRAERIIGDLVKENLQFNEQAFNAHRRDNSYPRWITIKDKYSFHSQLERLYYTLLETNDF